MRDDATEAETGRSHNPNRWQQCLAAAMAIAVLLSGLNALVQVGKAAVDYGCRRGWLSAECHAPVDRR